jgi:predicted RNA-binding protein
MPVGDVFISDTGGDVEHDDPALALDVVSISQTPELLLSSSVPDIEANCSEVSGELKRVDLDTESG